MKTSTLERWWCRAAACKAHPAAETPGQRTRKQARFPRWPPTISALAAISLRERRRTLPDQRRASLQTGCGQHHLTHRNAELESRSFTVFRFHPDPSPQACDNSRARSQADSGPRQLFAVQTLEDAENPLLVGVLDTDAVIADFKDPLAIPRCCRNMNARRP